MWLHNLGKQDMQGGCLPWFDALRLLLKGRASVSRRLIPVLQEALPILFGFGDVSVEVLVE